ncbi:MAG: lytic transglycosylase domain-containing protein, partial [Bdellovibrionota bacterium]
NLKILVSARMYPLAKTIVDYLFKENNSNFQKDEILFYRGRVYNALNEPLVGAEGYKSLIEKFPNSSYIKSAKMRYALSLQYAGQFEKSVQYVTENRIFSSQNEENVFKFWSYYLGKNYKKSNSILNEIQKSTGQDTTLFAKSFYWQFALKKFHPETNFNGKAGVEGKNLENFAASTTNYPYPIFARTFLNKPKENYNMMVEDSIQLKELGRFEKLIDDGFCKANKKNKSCSANKAVKNKLFLIPELVQAHLNQFAILQIKPLLNQSLNKKEELKLAYYSYLVSDINTTNKIINRNEKFDIKRFEFEKLSEDKKVLYKLNYPLAYWSRIQRASNLLKLDPFWLLSIMRAESLYNTNAESHVGAVGLMQIMPYTGVKILNYLTEPDDKFSVSMLRDPDKSIVFSAWYLKILLENYQGNYILATAAYNAGPAAINRWLKQNPSFNTVEFLENIPYNETKKYVSMILGSMDMYSRIYLNRPLALRFNVNKPLLDLQHTDDLF